LSQNRADSRLQILPGFGPSVQEYLEAFLPAPSIEEFLERFIPPTERQEFLDAFDPQSPE